METGRDRAQKARQADKEQGLGLAFRIIPIPAVLVHIWKWDTQGTGSGMLVPSSPGPAAPRVGIQLQRLQQAPSMQELLLFLVAVGFLLVIASLPGLLLTQQWESNCFVFMDRELSGQKLPKWRPRLCFGKQKNKPPWSGITSKLIKLHPQQGLLLQFQQVEMKNHPLQPA